MLSASEELTLGRNAHPKNERMDDMADLCMLEESLSAIWQFVIASGSA